MQLPHGSSCTDHVTDHAGVVALRGLSLVAVSRSTVHCSAWAHLVAGGFSCCRAQALGIRASVVASHRL